MATISTALRNFKEPSKDQLTQAFFSIHASTLHSATVGTSKNAGGEEVGKMEINAVLSLGEQGLEDSYVSFGAFWRLRIACH
jgi:hypothetical protein